MADRPDRDIGAGIAAHARLLAAIADLGDDDLTASSRLDGWTVGHVITHLARNAESHVRAFEGAEQGIVAARYPGGLEQRTAEIEQGFARPAAEQVADVAATAATLEAAWAAASPEAWAGSCHGNGAVQPMTDLPFLRRREVECHQVDLGLGYEPSAWPADYAAGEVACGTAALGPLPAAVAALPVQLQAGWLLGRHPLDGVPAPPQWF